LRAGGAGSGGGPVAMSISPAAVILTPMIAKPALRTTSIAR
jgi:hypothetical protein